MKKYILGALAFIGGCFCFWKLGKSKGKIEQELKTEKKQNEKIKKAVVRRNRIERDIDKLSDHYE